MTTSAILMMIVSMVIIWGGFIVVSIYSSKIEELDK